MRKGAFEIILKPDYNRRVKDLRSELDKAGIDAFLVSNIRDIRYLCGFTGSSGYAIVTGTANWFLTDSRYTTQAKSEVCRGFKTRVYPKAIETVTGIVAENKIKSLGFCGRDLSYDTYFKIKKALPGISLKSLSGIVSRIRARKDGFEIRLIQDSANILDLGFSEAAVALAAGSMEKEVAMAVELAFMSAGADGPAFDLIIASGPRGALPHGKASSKKIKKGELVVVDMGVTANGYNSDETRTYCIGKATKLQKKVYGIVKDAQSRAIEKIRPGVTASDVDDAARSFIGKAGYGKYFGHGTGHGVGLDIHEGPVIGPYSKDVLEEGVVVTVEPGIYLPDWGGVRIEDMALVVKDGCRLLTKTSREFVCL